jgi:hypothetical protein
MKWDVMKASGRDAPKDKVERGFLLNVVVAEGTAILELLSSKDETLLVRGNTVDSQSYMELWHQPLLILDFGLDIVDGVGRLHLEGDGLPGEGLDEDLHLQMAT